MFTEPEISMFQPSKRKPSATLVVVALIALGVAAIWVCGQAHAQERAQQQRGWVVYSCMVKACGPVSKVFATAAECEVEANKYPKPVRYGYDFDYHCGRPQ